MSKTADDTSMREIKFRAWDKKMKYMLSLLPIEIGEMLEDNEVSGKIRYILMQYTGLKDKNGKEIYHSDIIKINNVHYHEIVWCNGGFKAIEMKSMINMKFGDFWLHENLKICQCPKCDDGIKHYEVIGNIYKNKEMLK